jgi:polysaccharide pyruvyl transferase CsaB
MNAPTTRELVVVSGYYGFDNLGDEAILEELTSELKRIITSEKILVLSANPEGTQALFSVPATARSDLLGFIDRCKQSKVFVSGGGGLFQDTRSPGSVLYYGLQILLAKAFGCKVMVYAQGIGPLRQGISKWVTRRAFSAADVISVRDKVSLKILQDWGIEAVQTADPVWCLESKALPAAVEAQLHTIKSSRLIALSLRNAHNFKAVHLQALVDAMDKAMPANAHVLLVPLQMEQDNEPLAEFKKQWQSRGRESTLIDTSSLQYPAQWITLFGRCKLVVGMRLHALIMSMKAGVGVVGIAYDPKVSHLLTDFEQPALILTKAPETALWDATMQSAFSEAERLSHRAMRKAEGAKKLACQNFQLLAKIIDGQKSG